MPRSILVAMIASAVLLAAACGETPASQGTTSTTQSILTTTTASVEPTTTTSYDTPDDGSYEYPEEEAPACPFGEPESAERSASSNSGVSFADDWYVERGEIVLYGPDGASILDWKEGEERTLTDDPLAGLLAGPWGLVFHPASGEESARESTAGIWWAADAESAPIQIAPGNGELVTAVDDRDNWDGLMQLIDVFECEGDYWALIQLSAYQNDNLWILQPLSGGEPSVIGFLSGGEVDVSCAAWDGSYVYVASDAYDSQISKRSPTDGWEWTPFLPGGPEDVWPNASTCIASRSEGGFVVLVEQWPNEQGIDEPPVLHVLLDASGEIDSTLVLSDMSNLFGVDATDDGVILLSGFADDSWGDLEHWLNHEEGDHPVPLNSDHPFAAFVD